MIKTLTSTKNLYKAYLKTQPDVLVLDIRFDHQSESGLQACEAILLKAPSAKIVMLSQFDQAYIIKKSYQIGAYAFIRKNDSLEELASGIRAAQKGEKYFPLKVAQKMALSSIQTPNPTESLSKRELVIFILVANGKTQQEISNTQKLSMKTVNKVIHEIKEKLGLKRVTDFTKLGIQHHVISFSREM